MPKSNLTKPPGIILALFKAAKEGIRISDARIDCRIPVREDEGNGSYELLATEIRSQIIRIFKQIADQPEIYASPTSQSLLT